MGGAVASIFGGGNDAPPPPPPPDNSAQERQLAEMKKQNEEEKSRLDAENAKVLDEKRQNMEKQAASANARRRGGARALLANVRLNPEEGLPGQSSSQTTLGPKA